jgi:hypothetical protein
MWTIARSDVDPIARPTSHPRKIMMTIFFGVKNITLIDILLGKAKLSSEYFRKNSIKELDLNIYPTGWKVEAAHMFLHFDNAPFHNTRMVAQIIAECNFLRFNHIAYSLDLTLCDFFFFGYLHEKMARFVHEMIDELEEKIKVIIEAILKA